MKYKCPLIVVKDMERSRKFYEEILGQKVVRDYGANIIFKGDFSLQTEETWIDFIGKSSDSIIFQPNNFELYFEEKHFDKFVQKLELHDIEKVHDVKEYSWGQRVVRFYDPDGYVIEVGESMVQVVKRMAEEGLSFEEIAEKSQQTLEFVIYALMEKDRKKLVKVKY